MRPCMPNNSLLTLLMLLPQARVIVEDYDSEGPLRAHGEIARGLAHADSHLARELMRFVGLQQQMGPF